MKELFERERASHTQSADSHRVAGSTDLAALCGFVFVAGVVLVGWNPPAPPIRALVGVPLLFLAPGYAFVSLCFPGRTTAFAAGTTRAEFSTRRVTDAERIALSFASSLAILPILSVALASVATFETTPIVAAVAGVTVIGAFGAWIRRWRLPPTRRYRPGLRFSRLRTVLFPRGSPLLAATNVVLAISVLLALATGGYALLAPQDGERYTGMQLLSEDENGDLIAAGYPSAIDSGEPVPLTVAVENQEHRDVTYELVVLQERYVDGERRSREPIHQTSLDVSDGETVYSDLEVTPTVAAGQLRLVYLLYEDGVPTDPTPENAYRYTHLWIDVGDASPADPPADDTPPDEDDSDAEGNETDGEDGSDSDDGDGSDDDDDSDSGDEDGDDSDGGDGSDAGDGDDSGDGDGSGDGNSSDSGDGGGFGGGDDAGSDAGTGDGTDLGDGTGTGGGDDTGENGGFRLGRR